MGDRAILAAGRIKLKPEKPIDLHAIQKSLNMDDLDKDPTDADETDDMMNDPALLAELKEMGWKDPKKKVARRRRNTDEEAERELAALHDGEGDGDGSGGDDDDDLAALHSDDDEPVAPKKKVAKPSAAAAAVPKKKAADPVNTAAHRDAMIQKLTAYQTEATQKALELKRAGKQQESLDVFRQAKAAEARVKALQAGGAPGDDLAAFMGDMDKFMNRIKATATPSATTAATSRAPQPNASATATATVAAPAAAKPADTRASLIASLTTRSNEYRDACLAAKGAGRNEEAVRLFADMKKFKAAIEAIEAGNKVDASTLPPSLSAAIIVTPNKPAAAVAAPVAPVTKAPVVAAKVAAVAKPAEAKNQVKTPVAASSSSARVPAVPPRPSVTAAAASSASALSVRDEVLYEDLITKLNAQIDQLKTLMDQTYVGDDTKDFGPAPVKGGRAALEHAAKLKAAEPSKIQKQAALQYFRYKKSTTTSRDLLVAARRRGIRPPSYSTEKVTFDYELRHDDVKDVEMELNIKSARNLSAASIGAPDSLNGYVIASIDLGKPQQHKSSPLKGANPVWDGIWRFNIQDRSQATFRKFKFLKMSFQVWNKRSVFKDQLIGQAELKLQPLQIRSEIQEWVKLRNSDGKAAGDLQVHIRIRQPLSIELRDIRKKVHELLVIGDFPEERAPAPAPVARPVAVAAASPAVTPSSSSHHDDIVLMAPAAEILGEVEDLHEDTHDASAPVSHDDEEDLKDIENDEPSALTVKRAAVAAPAKVEPSLPAGITAAELRDPLAVAYLVSNDVLEAEMKNIDHRIATAKAQGKPTDELGERKLACFVALQVLVTKVQNGKITVDQYLDLLRKRLVTDQQLAVVLQQRSRAPEASQVMARVKIMQAEITSAEANKDSLDE